MSKRLTRSAGTAANASPGAEASRTFESPTSLSTTASRQSHPATSTAPPRSHGSTESMDRSSGARETHRGSFGRLPSDDTDATRPPAQTPANAAVSPSPDDDADPPVSASTRSSPASSPSADPDKTDVATSTRPAGGDPTRTVITSPSPDPTPSPSPDPTPSPTPIQPSPPAPSTIIVRTQRPPQQEQEQPRPQPSPDPVEPTQDHEPAPSPSPTPNDKPRPQPQPEPETQAQPQPQPQTRPPAAPSTEAADPTPVVPGAISRPVSSGFNTIIVPRPSSTLLLNAPTTFDPTFAPAMSPMPPLSTADPASIDADPTSSSGSSNRAAAIAVPLVLVGLVSAFAIYMFRAQLRTLGGKLLARRTAKHASHAWDGVEPEPPRDEWEFIPISTPPLDEKKDEDDPFRRIQTPSPPPPPAFRAAPSPPPVFPQPTASPRGQGQLPMTALVPLPRTPKTPPRGAAPSRSLLARGDDDAGSTYSRSSWNTSMQQPSTAGARRSIPPSSPIPVVPALPPPPPPPTAAHAIGQAVVRFLEPIRERVWGPTATARDSGPPRIEVSAADDASTYGDEDESSATSGSKLAYARPIVRSYDGSAASALSSSDARGSDKETLSRPTSRSTGRPLTTTTAATGGYRSSLASDGSARSSQRWSAWKWVIGAEKAIGDSHAM